MSGSPSGLFAKQQKIRKGLSRAAAVCSDKTNRLASTASGLASTLKQQAAAKFKLGSATFQQRTARQRDQRHLDEEDPDFWGSDFEDDEEDESDSDNEREGEENNDQTVTAVLRPTDTIQNKAIQNPTNRLSRNNAISRPSSSPPPPPPPKSLPPPQEPEEDEKDSLSQLSISDTQEEQKEQPQEEPKTDSWLRLDYSRADALELLKDKGEGSFLVRRAKRAGIQYPYSLSLKSGGRTFHLPILQEDLYQEDDSNGNTKQLQKYLSLGKQRNNNGPSIAVIATRSSKSRQRFLSLHELVEFYASSPLLLLATQNGNRRSERRSVLLAMTQL